MKIAVVGAGVVGLSVAYELTCRGAAVSVVDARGTGLGATRASAGILAPHIEGHSEALLTLGLRSLEAFDDFVARVGSDGGKPVDYRRTGTLQVARDEAEVSRLAAASARLDTLGVAHTLMDAAAAQRCEPRLGAVQSALFVPQHGYVSVPSLMAALASALSTRGTKVSVGSVQAIEPHQGGARVITSGRPVDADAVVVAAGSWCGEIEIPGSPRVPVRPIRGQLVHLRLPHEAGTRVIWGETCYLVPWQDGSVLVGATVEDVGFDEDATAGGVRDLLESAMTLVPGLRSAQFEQVRVGLRPDTTDGLPVIGPSSTMRGVFYATGHYRSGVLLAPFTAAAVAGLVLEGRGRPDLTTVRPDRFGL